MSLGDASVGLGLRHQGFLPKSLSTHEALFFRRRRRDISEAQFRSFWRQALPGMPAMLGPRSTKRCKYRQKTVLLLLWLARVLRGPCFFPLVFGPSGARARPQPQNAAIYGVLLHLRFRAGLRAALFGLLFLGIICNLGLGRATRTT